MRRESKKRRPNVTDCKSFPMFERETLEKDQWNHIEFEIDNGSLSLFHKYRLARMNSVTESLGMLYHRVKHLLETKLICERKTPLLSTLPHYLYQLGNKKKIRKLICDLILIRSGCVFG